jgi:hypothetical protein
MGIKAPLFEQGQVISSQVSATRHSAPDCLVHQIGGLAAAGARMMPIVSALPPNEIGKSAPRLEALASFRERQRQAFD